MTINELRSKRAKLWEGTKAFLETHRKENGTLSAEDDATYTKMEQEITDLGREISRLERQEAIEREMNAPTAKPLTTKPDATGKADTKTGRASDAYKNSNVKIGFSEPHTGGKRNAMLASILEYGKSGQPPKPFMKPAQAQSRKACQRVMKEVLEREVEKF